MLVEQVLQQGNFIVVGNFKELLFNCWECVDSVDFNGLWIMLYLVVDCCDCCWSGSRKQQCLLVSWCEVDYFINGVVEVYIEYVVCFVYYQGLQCVKGDCFFLQMIEQMVWGGDDNMWGMLQGILLGVKGLFVVEYQNFDVWQVVCQVVQFVGDLIGQFVGWV